MAEINELPLRKEYPGDDKYDIYPVFNIADDQIFTGFETLAGILRGHRRIILEGYAGVFFDIFKERLTALLGSVGQKVTWISTNEFLKHPDRIREMLKPFLGGDDPLFGTRCSLDLREYFNTEMLRSAQPDPGASVSIIAGPGAALAGWDGLLIYADLPKNVIRSRARSGTVTNLGTDGQDIRLMYKQFYFCDWIVLNRHKQELLPEIDIFIDAQRAEIPVWTEGTTLREALHKMSRNLFRARPWFEPGPWGGKWIKDNIPGLNKNVPNYAWSFELITPENGLIIESSSIMLEVSFDSLMFQEGESVLGDSFGRFHCEFPIRFDFLDTFNGGNLSIQCHPRPEYITGHFGENFTQEETYYILDAGEESAVYLGFRDDIDPEKFRQALKKSYNEKTELDPEEFILKHTSRKHDLFLIPYGTIHGSGKNNLVLEISTTPYIFTFKMYDWLRPDLDGNPRPLNIERGMQNLFFERKGEYVRNKLISSPVLVEEGSDWRLYRLSVHETHTYEIMRYHFNSSLHIPTQNKCLVMSLVEGSSISVGTKYGVTQRFSYAETFVIPAAAEIINITNHSQAEAILVFSFVK